MNEMVLRKINNNYVVCSSYDR